MHMSLRRKFVNARAALGAIVLLWREELSFKLEVLCGIVVLVLVYIFHVTEIEFMFLSSTFGAMLAIEALNTAIEELCDHVTLDHHPQIGKIKDLGSAATILFCTAGVVLCAIIFIPRIVPLL